VALRGRIFSQAGWNLFAEISSEEGRIIDRVIWEVILVSFNVLLRCATTILQPRIQFRLGHGLLNVLARERTTVILLRAGISVHNLLVTYDRAHQLLGFAPLNCSAVADGTLTLPKPQTLTPPSRTNQTYNSSRTPAYARIPFRNAYPVVNVTRLNATAVTSAETLNPWEAMLDEEGYLLEDAAPAPEARYPGNSPGGSNLSVAPVGSPPGTLLGNQAPGLAPVESPLNGESAPSPAPVESPQGTTASPLDGVSPLRNETATSSFTGQMRCVYLFDFLCYRPWLGILIRELLTVGVPTFVNLILGVINSDAGNLLSVGV
jgi:hypothetical protein